MPLVWAIGAGAELRQTLGTAVFAGMIGVTAFGLIFTPIFYACLPLIAQKTAPAPAYRRKRRRPLRNSSAGVALRRREG